MQPSVISFSLIIFFDCMILCAVCYQLPEFDNLYLDMNGIIHVCSHPEDENPHFRITEEKIFADIFHYIEVRPFATVDRRTRSL